MGPISFILLSYNVVKLLDIEFTCHVIIYSTNDMVTVSCKNFPWLECLLAAFHSLFKVLLIQSQKNK